MALNRFLLSTAGALTGAMVLMGFGQNAIAVPGFALGEAALAPVTPVDYHGRHHVRRRVHSGYRAVQPDASSAEQPYGGYAARPTSGSPPDNMFDPTRPYGGQAAITAPPGTDAYEEQANQRRYFCDYSPSRC